MTSCVVHAMLLCIRVCHVLLLHVRSVLYVLLCVLYDWGYVSFMVCYVTLCHIVCLSCFVLCMMLYAFGYVMVWYVSCILCVVLCSTYVLLFCM